MRDFSAILLSIFVMCVALGMTSPLLAIILEGRGTSTTLIGLNSSMLALALFIMSPLAGTVVSRWGVKATIHASLACASVCVISFKVFEELWVWFILRFLLGTAEAFIFVVSEIWINRTAPDNKRGRWISLYGISIAGGFLLGASIVLVTGSQGWTPFLLGGALIAITILPATFIQNIKFTIEESRPVPIFSIIKKYPVPLWGGFAFGAIELGMYSMVIVYALHNGFEERMATSFLLALNLGNILLQFPIGILADRTPKLALLLRLASSSAVLMACLPWLIKMPGFVYPCMFVFGGLIISIYNVSLSMIGEQAKGSELVSANSAMASMYGLGALVSPTMMGIAMQVYDPHGYVIAVSFLLFAYAAFLATRLLSRTKKSNPKPT